MKYYEDFLRLEVFNFKDAQKIVGNAGNTKVLLNAYVEKGLLKHIRRDLYCVVNLENRNAPANRYVIASKINENSYLAYHSAFEVHGLSHQVSFVMYVASTKKFSDFEFEGVQYKYTGKGIQEGIIKHRLNQKIMVTDLERTIIDSLKRLEYCGGPHELDEILRISPVASEKKLVKYLKQYDVQFLYKKAGYFLERHQHSLGITSELLTFIEERTGVTKKYLSEEAKNGSGELIKRWGLIVPKNLENHLDGELFV